MDVDVLRCVLSHWHEFGGKPSIQRKRFRAIKDLHVLYKNRGGSTLLDEINRAAEGKTVLQSAHLVVGAGLFLDDVRMETLVRKMLDHSFAEVRLEAVFASSFFILRSEEIATILATIVIKDEDEYAKAASMSFRLAQTCPCSNCSLYTSSSWCPSKTILGTAESSPAKYVKPVGEYTYAKRS